MFFAVRGALSQTSDRQEVAREGAPRTSTGAPARRILFLEVYIID
jgi:hypothetical protein